MELDLQSLFLGSWVQLFSFARNSPPPLSFGLKYEGAYWSAKIGDISVTPLDPRKVFRMIL